jgi:four helix bundle protein
MRGAPLGRGVTPEQLRQRSMHFAVRVVRFCRTLPQTWEARQIGGQLLAAATSAAMNYRAAGRGRSHREFTAKMGTVAEESDENVGWLELTEAVELAEGDELQWLLAESRQLLAIFGSSYHTALENRRRADAERHPRRG